jgi:DNA-binding SARP family transcriptional activator
LGSRSPRLVAGLATIGIVLALVGRALRPGLMANTAPIANPYGLLSRAPTVLRAAEASGTFLLALAMIGSILALILRFRRAAGTERLELKWLAYAGGLVAVAFSVGSVLELLGLPELADTIRVPSLLALPVAMAVAILRYHLFDIDVVISRTVVFAGLAVFITAVYVALVVGIGAAVGRGAGSNLALAVVATALVAVAFQPLRERLQRTARRVVFGTPTPAEERAGVAVTSLGAFRVIRDGGVVPLTAWQSRKARTLLKILVARRGRSTTREYLMEELWPDEPPELVTRRLSVALATLRAVLDPDKRHPPDRFVIGDRHALRLDLGSLPIDVEQFLATAGTALAPHHGRTPAEAMAELMAAEVAYTGDFLEEDPYEEWAAPLREEARTTYLSVVRALGALTAARGDTDAAVRYHLRLLDKDPWDASAHLALVGTLERAGRHGEARRCYRSYASRMEELHVPVTPFPSSSPA